MRPMTSNREQKRLDAAEHLCRCFRKAISYHATQQVYMDMALDWLMVWMDNAPQKVKYSDPTPCHRKRRPA